ncbi:MAG: exodeoxyribonuclease VII small subunit [Gemmatimonadetes bacterium]|nr:exodeoxyribonuclease VII small subunit [Gemmatimonadota bacterium]NNM06189.1 exodeoxyribonuclease VII small subunit [Gemmatimonadota bacterium]
MFNLKRSIVKNEADGTNQDVEGTGPGEGNETLEARLKRLEEIVGRLESEDLELDRALALFEEGVGHVKEAEKTLTAAELRVEELLGEAGEGGTRPFDEAEE